MSELSKKSWRDLNGSANGTYGEVKGNTYLPPDEKCSLVDSGTYNSDKLNSSTQRDK